MRNVQVSGRVANFGKVFKAAEGEKGAFCVKVTANGYWADRLNAFEPGEMVYLTGKLDKENDWTNNEGELVKGGLYIRCEMIDNWAANNDNANANASASAKSAPTKKTPAKPAAKGGRPARPSMA